MRPNRSEARCLLAAAAAALALLAPAGASAANQPVKCRAELGNVRQMENTFRRLRNQGCGATLTKLTEAANNVRAAASRYLACDPGNSAGLSSTPTVSPRPECPADRRVQHGYVPQAGAGRSCQALWKNVLDRKAAVESYVARNDRVQESAAREAFRSAAARYLQCNPSGTVPALPPPAHIIRAPGR